MGLGEAERAPCLQVDDERTEPGCRTAHLDQGQTVQML
jgi:hypothetical protein